MTASIAQESPTTATAVRRRYRFDRLGILLTGVLLVPFLLTALLNSYGPLTVDGAIRMAFATVAGQTIAILSTLAVLGITLARWRRTDHALLPQVILCVALAAVVTLHAVVSMSNAGDVLLSRLDLIAEIDQLNR
jgi:hypothetical protein